MTLPEIPHVEELASTRATWDAIVWGDHGLEDALRDMLQDRPA